MSVTMAVQKIVTPAGSLSEVPRYSPVAVFLHWAIAAAIICNLSIGMFMEQLPGGMRTQSVKLHISIGISVLALVIVRLSWRLTHRPPPLDSYLSSIEISLARIVHAALYPLMLALPLIGWMLISASKTSLSAHPMIFGLVPLPLPGGITHLPQPFKEQLHVRLISAHSSCAGFLAGLLTLHFAGVFKHVFLEKRPQLRRMTIAFRRKGPLGQASVDPNA